jgi:hypothetical protein
MALTVQGCVADDPTESEVETYEALSLPGMLAGAHSQPENWKSVGD